MNDTPAASHRSLWKYLLHSVDSLARAGLKFLVASFESRLNFDIRNEGGAVRDIAVHTGDILGRGVPDASSKTRVLSEFRAWQLGAQEKSFLCAGAGFPEENDSSVELTQGPSPNNLKPAPTSPELWASRPRTLSSGEIAARQWQSGGLSCMSAVSMLDICARSARIA